MARVRDQCNTMLFAIALFCATGVTSITAQSCYTTPVNCCFCRKINAVCPYRCYVTFKQCPVKNPSGSIIEIFRRKLGPVAKGGLTTPTRQIAPDGKLMISARQQLAIVRAVSDFIDQAHAELNRGPNVGTTVAFLSVTKSVVGSVTCLTEAGRCGSEQTIEACESCVDNCNVWQPILFAVSTSLVQLVLRTSLGYVCHGELGIGTVMDLSQVISHYSCKNNAYWLRRNVKPKLRPAVNINVLYV